MGAKDFYLHLKGCEFRYNEWHNLYTENDSNTFVQIDKYLQILSQGDIQWPYNTAPLSHLQRVEKLLPHLILLCEIEENQSDFRYIFN
jgi:hypothetical protein